MNVITLALSVALFTSRATFAFLTSPIPSHVKTKTSWFVTDSQVQLNMSSSPPMPDPERMKQIMDEEARNPENMKASAAMLKNLSPQDIESMIREMENMPAAQRKQLEAMGMNTDLMRQSMEMMKANPEMAKQMANMMETMSPEEMLEKSKQAQAMFGSTPSPINSSDSSSNVVDAQIIKNESDDDINEDTDEEESEPIPLPEKEILDTLYRTAEIMSDPPNGKVTFAGFSCIPPIALLVGNDSERDLSKVELKECWADGSLGSTRVDREGFERVLMEVQEYFSIPMLEKARERTRPSKRGSSNIKASKPIETSASSTIPTSSTGPVVGENIPVDVLERQVKSMSDSDMDMMLKQMQDMTPEQEARMKAMGVDPAIMKRTASMMNSNPLMKGAAKMMMKNMSAEQMKQASQQAQEQMSKMTPEQIEKAYEELEKKTKDNQL